MMRKTSLLILFGLLFFNAQSQMIKAISFEKENSVFKLTYDLPEIATSYDVILTSNYLTGKAFVKVTENALGDVGENISSGKNKTIYWQPKKDEDFNEAILAFKIVMIPLASANNSSDNGEPNPVAKQKKETKKNEGNVGDPNSNKSENGTRSGRPGSGNSKEKFSTTGNGKTGAGADISGRTVRSKPKPPTNYGVNGIVIVKICVDTKGNVVSSRFTQNGSTTTQNKAIADAVANAKRWKFNENSMAPDKQCGAIKFYYKTE